MVIPACQQPIYQKELGAPVEHSSFFSVAKITRLALRILSLVMVGSVIYIGAHIIVGNISLWYLSCVIGLLVLRSIVSGVANSIVDFNDPAEVKLLQEGFAARSMTEMLKKYPLETIIRHNIVSLNLLRGRCCVNLLARKYQPLPVLRRNADGLLKYRIITPEIHRALIADNVKDLRRLVPNNSIDLDRMFKDFDAKS